MSMYPIASATTTGNQTVNFSSIPQNFKHLQLRVTSRASTATLIGNAYIWFNGIITNNQFRVNNVYSNGTSYTAASILDNAFDLPNCGGSSAGAGYFGSSIVEILNYTDTNKLKLCRAIGGNDDGSTGAAAYSGINSGLWVINGTSAITDIGIQCYGNATGVVAGAHYELYGILGA